MKNERPFWMAGLWAEAHDPATGEVADTYTVIITDANAAMRVHDRMPVILATDAARRWIEPGALPAERLVPYPAKQMRAWPALAVRAVLGRQSAPLTLLHRPFLSLVV